MTLIVEPRIVKISTRTEIDIRRSLPHAKLGRIGAWVFLDHFGPTNQVDGMVVASHPHTGLQTVTWPFAGQVHHHDTIGSSQVLRAGQLNLMTAGRGIAHSEKSLQIGTELHAAQLWLALPDNVRGIAPSFEHHADLPKKEFGDASVTLFIGEFAALVSPAQVFSPLVGAELRMPVDGKTQLPINPEWQHGLLVAQGSVVANGQPVGLNELAYFDIGSSDLEITATEDFVGLLLGGAPFEEKIIMWWNFIARSQEEIVSMREHWNLSHEDFGTLVDQIGDWIRAPELPNVTLRVR
jgi:redox-sensitive bicupin YhaK (pirin superfamily)